MKSRSTIVLLACCVCGCQGEFADAGFTYRDSAGIRILSTTAGPDSGTLPWSLDSIPSLSIGTTDGDEASQFFEVGDVVRLSGGRIALENRGTNEIRLLDASGAHVSTSGATGDGPGEYRSLAGLKQAPDGSLLVFDRGQGRLTILDSEARVIRTIKFQPTGSGVHPLRLYRLGGLLDDSLVVLTALAYPADMQPRPMVYWDSVPTLAYQLSGILEDTVAEFSGMDMYATGSRTGALWFGRHSSADVAAGEVYMTDGGAYEVRVYSSRGELRRILRHNRDPRGVSGEDESELSEAYMGAAVTDELRRQAREMLAEYPRAEVKPWISGLLVDATGCVWVQEWEPLWSRAASSWGVFDSEGRWRGRVRFPLRFAPKAIGADYVLGVFRDDLNVEHVQLYGLHRQGQNAI